MIVSLSESEIQLAYMVAGQRRGQNARLGRTPRYGAGVEDWKIDIIGCLGELAVAKATNKFWSGSLGNLKAKDVGGIQVRATDYPQGRLILHPADADDDRFVLVRIAGTECDLRGWVFGKDGKQQKYWVENDPKWPKLRPAFFVPDESLTRFPNDQKVAA